jgi:hypothetical protein
MCGEGCAHWRHLLAEDDERHEGPRALPRWRVAGGTLPEPGHWEELKVLGDDE